MNINLAKNVALTTERAESSYGVPVLAINGVAYGSGDDFGAALRDELRKDFWPELSWLLDMYTGGQLLASMCREYDEDKGGYAGPAHVALDLFCAQTDASGSRQGD